MNFFFQNNLRCLGFTNQCLFFMAHRDSNIKFARQQTGKYSLKSSSWEHFGTNSTIKSAHLLMVYFGVNGFVSYVHV